MMPWSPASANRVMCLALIGVGVGNTQQTAAQPAAELASCFNSDRMRATGESYRAMVPDTLDLAEQARLAVRGLLNFMDETRDYEQYQLAFFNVQPAFMAHYGMEAGNQGKIAEGIVKMRNMSGSTENLDKQEVMFRGILKRINKDGLFVNDFSKSPWANLIRSADQLPVNTSRMMLALKAIHEQTGCEPVAQLVNHMADGIEAMARYENDHAWFTRVPPETNPDAIGVLGYWQDLFYHAVPIRCLAHVHAMRPQERALRLSEHLRRFLLHNKKYWAPSAFPKEVVCEEHAIFSGHHHTYTAVFMALLELARVTGNTRDLEFVRDGYQYVRLYGIARIGLFGENCTVGDMTWLATKMSLMGIGDYWDDVDCYVRNQLAEAQLTDERLLKQAVAQMPAMSKDNVWEFEQMQRHGYTTDRVVERNVGAFMSDASNPTLMRPQTLRWTICCSGNCPPALYAVWDGMVQGKDDVVQVNLLLNRASQWLDVDSYLPYGGKLVLHNKSARVITVRMPRRVDLSAVRVSINNEPEPAIFAGRYVLFTDAKSGDRIEITFPVEETEETYSLLWKEEDMWPESTYLGAQWTPPTPPQRYTFRFRGNTVVDVTPRSRLPGMPLYVRETLKGDRAPKVERERFVPSRHIAW